MSSRHPATGHDLQALHLGRSEDLQLGVPVWCRAQPPQGTAALTWIPSRKRRRCWAGREHFLRSANQLRMSHEGLQLVGYYIRVDAGRHLVSAAFREGAFRANRLNEHAKDVVWAVTHYQTAGRARNHRGL